MEGQTTVLDKTVVCPLFPFPYFQAPAELAAHSGKQHEPAADPRQCR